MEPEDKVNILVVDDRPDKLSFLKIMLSNPAYNLVTVNSGLEALRCLLQQEFAVILLDIKMPDMDGFQTAALIRQHEHSRRTPIIFVTGSQEETDITRGYALGAVDFLTTLVPQVLKTKVGVFVDLFRMREQLRCQAEQLGAANQALREEIVERQRVEYALRETEAKYRTLVEHTPAITYIAALGRFSLDLYLSPQVETLLGFTPQEWLADPDFWLNHLHPDDRKRVIAEAAHTDVTGEPFVSEYRMLARDGRVVWFRDEAVTVHDPAGRSQFWQGVRFDITASKRLEEGEVR